MEHQEFVETVLSAGLEEFDWWVYSDYSDDYPRDDELSMERWPSA